MVLIEFDDINKDSIYSSFIDILRSALIGKNISSIEILEYMSQPAVFLVKPETNEKGNEPDRQLNHHGTKFYDKLKYKILSSTVTNDLSKLMRDSYLKSIGRRLPNSNDNASSSYLEPGQIDDTH